jgi:alpha-glucosidase
MNSGRLFLRSATAALLSLPLAGQGTAPLASPDGKLAIRFEIVSSGTPAAAGGQLTYEVSFEGKPVIARSNLGLLLEGAPVLGSAVRLVAAEMSSHDETYRLVHGKSNPVRDHYNALRLELEETRPAARRLAVEARAYEDGIAFRYLVPDQPAVKAFRLAAEKTEFRIPKDSFAYPLFLRNFHTSYEDRYSILPIGSIHPDRLIALPLLIELAGTGWLAITEAYLDNYAGMYLRRDVEGTRTGFSSVLSPSLEEPGLAVAARTPHRSPWRVVLFAPEVGRLLESNLIVNLNPPPSLQDTSWIKPGKAAWDWWFGRVKTEQGFETGMDTRTFLYLVDFAARSGFEYVLVDAGWSDRIDITRHRDAVDIPAIIRYARSKGIGIWLWVHWTGVDAHMNEAFALYEKWGAAGVKIDFMDRDDQWMVNWYRRVVEKAAAHRLMVDFHGAFKPDGLRRTWPNLLTREGALGLEYAKWSFAVEPEHNVTLPFTRLLAGPFDYTPGGFDNVTKAEFTARRDDPMVLGTRAHHLALFVVLESPFMVVADHPSAYEGQPAFEFIKKVPVSWDETRVINAQAADFITVARRRGRDWFVGSLTDWSARELPIPLSFLPPGAFTAEIYADAPDADRFPKNVTISRRAVTRADVLTARLAPGGGHAIHIFPTAQEARQ